MKAVCTSITLLFSILNVTNAFCILNTDRNVCNQNGGVCAALRHVDMRNDAAIMRRTIAGNRHSGAVVTLESSAQDREQESLREDDLGQQTKASSSSYDTSDSSSKGIVSSLTGIVNFVMGSNERGSDTEDTLLNNSLDDRENLGCTTPQQLMDKIRDDYVENNYLWTGNIFLPAFDPNCQFTDPTLSFVGRDKFVSNVQNLQPIVDFFVGENNTVNDVCKSDLLNIEINEQERYVESRWNMVGQLDALPWKPKIDVIGRTKFWYRDDNSNTDASYGKNISALRVYFYDEQWEMPAYRALLQLVTPAGTITSDS